MVKLVLPEADSERAETLWTGWHASEVTVYAPALMPFEVTSAIRKHVQRGLVTAEHGASAVEAFSALGHGIVLAPAEDLHARAWALAAHYQRPNLYDAYYVALAESLGCPLWSADDHLRRVMPDHTARIAPLSP
jgi:predicted nucleic acid-binding protein